MAAFPADTAVLPLLPGQRHLRCLPEIREKRTSGAVASLEDVVVCGRVAVVASEHAIRYQS